jgi:hypothetical protein
LLQPIQRLPEEADMIRTSRILKPRWLLTVDSLRQVAMKEGVLHIQLMNRPPAGQSQREHGAHSGGLDDGAERLIEVNTRSLGETTENPAGLIPL